MPPKADQTTTPPGRAAADKATPTAALTLPGLPLATNGRHNQPKQEYDHGEYDQDDNAADPMQALLGSMLNNDDEDGDDVQEFEKLRSVLATVLKAKAEKNQKKQLALLQELQQAAAQEVASFEAAVANDHKKASATLTTSINAAKKKLADKFQAIEALSNKYQQDLSAAWAEYTALYNKVDETKRAASVQIEKLRGSHKRKLTELQASLASKLTDTDQKLAKIDSKSGRAKGIEGILQQFMAAPAE